MTNTTTESSIPEGSLFELNSINRDIAIEDVNNLTPLSISQFFQFEHYPPQMDLQNIIGEIINYNTEQPTPQLSSYGFNEDSILEILHFEQRYEKKLRRQARKQFVKDLTYDRVSEGQCIICQNSFNKRCKVPVLKCKHHFHKTCLMKWMNKKLNCPLCRSDLTQFDQDF